MTAFERGADGVGLFRTEMLFLGKDHAPPEEEQFAIYAQTARAAAGRLVIIRTLDVGGDKPLPFLEVIPAEGHAPGSCYLRLELKDRMIILTTSNCWWSNYAPSSEPRPWGVFR